MDTVWDVCYLLSFAMLFAAPVIVTVWGLRRR